MGANQKLQGEINQLLKKVQDGVDAFDKIWHKFEVADDVKQKEKFEAIMKIETKKLRRYRDSIKTLTDDFKIKKLNASYEQRLGDACKQIEHAIDRHKICEEETKTKAFSNKGLDQQPKTDPKESAKSETEDWIKDMLGKLQSDIFEAEAEAEAEGLSVKKGKIKSPRLTHFETSIARHKALITKLELILRLLDNDRLSPNQVNDVKDYLDYYLQCNQDCFDEFSDYVDVDELYNTLVKALEDLVPIGQPKSMKASVTSRSSVPKSSPHKPSNPWNSISSHTASVSSPVAGRGILKTGASPMAPPPNLSKIMKEEEEMVNFPGRTPSPKGVARSNISDPPASSTPLSSVGTIPRAKRNIMGSLVIGTGQPLTSQLSNMISPQHSNSIDGSGLAESGNVAESPVQSQGETEEQVRKRTEIANAASTGLLETLQKRPGLAGDSLVQQLNSQGASSPSQVGPGLGIQSSSLKSEGKKPIFVHQWSLLGGEKDSDMCTLPSTHDSDSADLHAVNEDQQQQNMSEGPVAEMTSGSGRSKNLTNDDDLNASSMKGIPAAITSPPSVLKTFPYKSSNPWNPQYSLGRGILKSGASSMAPPPNLSNIMKEEEMAKRDISGSHERLASSGIEQSLTSHLLVESGNVAEMQRRPESPVQSQGEATGGTCGTLSELSQLLRDIHLSPGQSSQSSLPSGSLGESTSGTPNSGERVRDHAFELQMLQAGYSNRPQPEDSELTRSYTPTQFRFFNSWRVGNPTVWTNEYEQGTYIFFDIRVGNDGPQQGWCKRYTTPNFTIAYRFLEAATSI